MASSLQRAAALAFRPSGRRRPLAFVLNLALIAALASLGPAERTLGPNVRSVYLHGAWVWTALTALALAAAFGLLGLATGRAEWHSWSRVLGWTGLVFWVTYLPLSLWAMQANWNGLFLAEPRWRLAVSFALAGLSLQTGLALTNRPRLTSGLNLLYAAALGLALQFTGRIMHPPRPVLDSPAWRIQVFFALLLGLTLLLAAQLAGWLHRGTAGRVGDDG